MKRWMQALFALLAMTTLSLTLTACGDDDDDNGGGGGNPTTYITVDGVEKNITKAEYEKRSDGGKVWLYLYLADGTELDFGIQTANFGKRIDLSKDDTVGDGDYDSAEYYYVLYDLETGESWYGDNDPEDVCHLASGSYMKFSVSGNTYTGEGKLVYSPELDNDVYDGKTHTITFNIKVTATEYASDAAAKPLMLGKQR